MEPILYIFMRDDLDSLNPGKACAQAAHAANHAGVVLSARSKDDHGMAEFFNKWQWSTSQGFGTTIVFSAPIAVIEDVDQTASSMNLLHSIIHDPTYPLRDGAVTHLIPLNTCSWVFCDKHQMTDLLSQIPYDIGLMK